MKTLVIQVNYNRLRGIKPNNELAYYDINGQTLCEHTHDAFTHDISFYTLVDKTLKSKYTGPVNTLKKENLSTFLPSIIEIETPDRLVVVDDTAIFNRRLAEGLEKCGYIGAVCDLYQPIERGYLGGILRDGEIRNVAYGLTQKDRNIVSFGNIYVFASGAIDELYSTYLRPQFRNYALFEIINHWIDLGKSVIPITGSTHKLLSIRTQQDLYRIKDVINENTFSLQR